MGLPIYKKIIIKSASVRQINSQLDMLDFGENPFIIEFVDTIDDHQGCIDTIEKYLTEHEINTFSYSIFVVSHKSPETNLKVISSSSLAPSFFKQKSKQLTVKESQKLDVVKLKQRRLDGLRRGDFEPYLESYGKNSKKISILHNESTFYSRLLDSIKELEDVEK